MKIRIYIIILIIQLTFFNNIAKSNENKILFKINNEIITTLDLLNEIKYLKTLNADFKEFDQNKIYEISKNSLIREKIKEIELLKFYKSIKVNDEYLKYVEIWIKMHTGIFDPAVTVEKEKKVS